MANPSLSPWGWESHWPAPAKLNLFLHVVGRRPDGYHRLQTVFRFLDRGDHLRFAPRNDGRICLQNPLPGVAHDSDLTVRAARLLQATTACRQGVTILLEKCLPMGGGLGGGSSDAATVLLALNQLWETGLSRQHLQNIGLQLGADVPVFIQGQNAFAEGVGELLTPLELPPSAYLILEPPVQVPTALIFSDPDLKRDTPAMQAKDWQPGQGRNDLEAVACRLFPAVAEHLALLRRYTPAMMTGSGACVFATFPTLAMANAMQAALPANVRAWVAQGLAVHPLSER